MTELEIHPELKQLIDDLTPDNYEVFHVSELQDFGFRTVTFKHVLGDYQVVTSVRLGCDLGKVRESIQRAVENGNRDAIRSKDWYEFRNQFNTPDGSSLVFEKDHGLYLSFSHLVTYLLIKCNDWRGLTKADVDSAIERFKRELEQAKQDAIEREAAWLLSAKNDSLGELNNNEFLLFAGHCYYPHGGAEDFRLRGTVEECKAFFENRSDEIAGRGYVDNWGQIVDPVTLKIGLYGLNDKGRITWSKNDPNDD
jgi:hypothetical protein